MMTKTRVGAIFEKLMIRRNTADENRHYASGVTSFSTWCRKLPAITWLPQMPRANSATRRKPRTASKSRTKKASARKSAPRVVVVQPRPRAPRRASRRPTMHATTRKGLKAGLPRVRHAVSEMLAMPHFAPTVRLSTGYTGVPTAIASPFAIVQNNWSQVASSGLPVPNGQTFVAVSRSPLQSMVQWNGNAAHQNYGYQGRFTQFNGTTPIGITDRYTFAEVATPVSLPIQRCDHDTGFPLALHGPSYYPVDIEGRKAVWIDGHPAHAFAYVVLHSGITREEIRATAYLWEGNFWRKAVSDAALPAWTDGHELHLGIAQPGYYSFELDGPSGASSTNVEIAFNFSGSEGAFAITPLPHWEDMEVAVDTVRVSAVSLMLTPNAPKLYTGGQVTGLQLPNNKSWYYPMASGDPYSTISSDQNSETMTFENGIYGFLKPTDPHDFELVEPTITYGGIVVAYNNPYRPPGGWLAVAAMVSEVESSYPGGLAHTTVCYACEFQTVSPWFEVAPPTVEVSDFEKAMRVTSRMKQWHANSFHIGDILKFIYSGAKTVLGAAPAIANVVSAIAPEASPIANLVGHIAGQIGGILPAV